MNNSIHHRGPDAAGFHEDDDVALGMRRLAIIDVAHGDQPVYSENADVIAVFNGEIYNFRQLQECLRARGHRLKSDSDSECIPHLYEEFGPDFVRQLRGMFAIALWDKPRKRLLLARDRFGKKPLYYRQWPGGISFGSELQALLTDGRLDRAIDETALSHYLTFQYVPAPWSVYKDVRKVKPGHIALWEDGRLQQSEYWSLPFEAEAPSHPDDPTKLVVQLREQLIDSVRIRMTSERPIGAYLSGGLDSSAIVAAMSQVSREPVRTFSIGFEDERFNELPFARQVADRYGTDHHERIVRPSALDVLPGLARAFGEPFADSSAIPSFYVSQLAKEHVTVVLNGDGGDELFGGYGRYGSFLQLRSAEGASLKRRARHAVKNLLNGGSKTTRTQASESAQLYGLLVSYFDLDSKSRVLTRDFNSRVQRPDSYELLDRFFDDEFKTDDLNRLLAADSATYLPGDLLTKVDITTMSFSLEARSPLLDHQLAEWAAQLPGGLKHRNGESKWLLKQALQGWLPDDLITRPKQGFAVPIGDWLRGPLRPLVLELLPNGHAVSNGWLAGREVRSLVRRHMLGADLWARLYALLMLELWVREVHEAPAEIPA